MFYTLARCGVVRLLPNVSVVGGNGLQTSMEATESIFGFAKMLVDDVPVFNACIRDMVRCVCVCLCILSLCCVCWQACIHVTHT